MKFPTPTLSLDNDFAPFDRPLERLLHLWNVVYLGALSLTLGAILWNTPGPWSWVETALIVLVVAQAALYLLFFGAIHHPQKQLTHAWVVAAYFPLSVGLWLLLWRLEASFWWVIWVLIAQMHLFLPLKIAIPATGLIFFIVAHYDNGFMQFFSLPLNQMIAQVIPWLAFSLAFSWLSLMIRINRERTKLIIELKTARQELELAHQQEVELAALRERERLARDLHDSLGHTLVTLSVQLEAVQRLYPVNANLAAQQLEAMKSLTRDSMGELRRTLAGLRAVGLDNRRLCPALKELCLETGRRTGLNITAHVDFTADRLNPALSEALWRVAQEALLNVEKHASARQVKLELQVLSKRVTLMIADDGLGLPPDAANRPGHYGLRGMRERIEGLGGEITLSRDNQWTTIKADLPLIGGVNGQ
jgi:signal transduction histidine kinase